jgi:hypothetical protein
VERYSVNKRRRRRARRFPIGVPLCYRVVGDDVWRFGTSTNMSRSGMLFVGDSPLEPQTRIELTFELPASLPASLPGERGAQVMCRGTITRSRSVNSTDNVATIATNIDAYRLVRIGIDRVSARS